MNTPSIILFNKPSETEKFNKEKFLNSLKQFGEFDSKIVDEGLKELSQFPVRQPRPAFDYLETRQFL